ncbi:hypothetical protein M441DRAFT_452320 [Trichoderma asperellum CBS 433.97]|uniref:Uncharacterized protein n=1 Tax=Trichoderma asperellum (strain ATCC 204424 / CBS 433.97 / NBRC 101777) TaxID=1042311 RepID=A0A2T3YSB2_TRIA4|nr:hypothetical protein M441DRAFT_452320 [Trichoderma asperellum CBS 433.97]PTB35461.1 hypothetical protein M441DRAFT_452320 [Trichoderma asperellum CBS 433.97]
MRQRCGYLGGRGTTSSGVFLVTPASKYTARHLHSLQQHRRDGNASGDQTSISGQRGGGCEKKKKKKKKKNLDSGPTNANKGSTSKVSLFFLAWTCANTAVQTGEAI